MCLAFCKNSTPSNCRYRRADIRSSSCFPFDLAATSHRRGMTADGHDYSPIRISNSFLFDRIDLVVWWIMPDDLGTASTLHFCSCVSGLDVLSSCSSIYPRECVRSLLQNRGATWIGTQSEMKRGIDLGEQFRRLKRQRTQSRSAHTMYQPAPQTTHADIPLLSSHQPRCVPSFSSPSWR